MRGVDDLPGRFDDVEDAKRVSAEQYVEHSSEFVESRISEYGIVRVGRQTCLAVSPLSSRMIVEGQSHNENVIHANPIPNITAPSPSRQQPGNMIAPALRLALAVSALSNIHRITMGVTKGQKPSKVGVSCGAVKPNNTRSLYSVVFSRELFRCFAKTCEVGETRRLRSQLGLARPHSSDYTEACSPAFSRLASWALAQTARSLAQARNSAISSARVIDSGTVDESAVRRSLVLSSCLRANTA